MPPESAEHERAGRPILDNSKNRRRKKPERRTAAGLDEGAALAAALARLLQVWCLLLAGAWLPFSHDLALPVCFLAATARVWRAPFGRHRNWRARPATDLGLLLSGIAIEPALGRLIGALGLGLGLRGPLSSALSLTQPGHCLASIVLAPVFEEALYRGDLLTALRPVCGRLGAALASSALFALSHLDPWAVLGTFVVGLSLSALRQRGGRLAACVAAHAGLNLSTLVRESATLLGA